MPIRMKKEIAGNGSVVFMYSGQGSQYYKMGEELYETDDIFSNHMDECAEICKQQRNVDLIEVLYHPKEKHAAFEDLELTSPALCAIQYSLTKMLMAKGIKPNAVLGYSLGEFVASVITGVLPIDFALCFLIDKSKVIKNKVPKGRMMSVIANQESFENQSFLFRDAKLIAHNSPMNFVVSGNQEDIDALGQHLSDQYNASAIQLPVSYPLHTHLVDHIKEDVNDLTKSLSFQASSIDMYSCEKGALFHESISGQHYWNVIRNDIKFRKTIQSVAEDRNRTLFVDLGPSGTLANFVKQNMDDTLLANCEVTHLINPFGNNKDSVAACLANIQSYLNDN